MRKLNNGFTCSGCGAQVTPAHRTTRNHCPHCFISQHVDGDIPGDRDTQCGGAMIPVAYLIKHGKQKIQFTCISCGKVHTNKAASDDDLGEVLNYIQLYKKKYLKEVQ